MSPSSSTATPSTKRSLGVGIRSGAHVGGRIPNQQKGTTSPSSTCKRTTPPTSPRVRRPISPTRRNPSPVPSIKADIGINKGTRSSSKKVSSPATTPTTPGTSGFSKRPISPTVSGKRPPSPTTPVKRPPSPTTPGKRQPSPSNSRASSPGSVCRAASPGSRRPASPRGTSPRGRGASPGSRNSGISEETLKARVSRATKARLYLLHQPGPNSFTVAGDSPTHKYKVIIGPQVSFF